MELFKIKHRVTRKILFSFKCESFKACVKAAIKAGYDLRGSNLSYSDLRGSNLSDSLLRGSDLRGSNLKGSILRGSDLNYSNLRGSNLSYSDLRGSNLSYSDLSYSDLRGSKLSGSILSCSNGKRIKIKKTPLQILGLQWPVIIFDSHMKIGCEFHSIKEWDKFNNDSINYMGSNALEFWKQNKSAIMIFCEANERGEGKDSK